MHDMPHVTPSQTFKNQELACVDGKWNSILICVPGLMFLASLPSFWPRFLLWAYLPGPNTNIIPALTQIHCLYLFQFTRVSCFGLIYETWCVTRVTLMKSQMGQVGISRFQSDIWFSSWLSAGWAKQNKLSWSQVSNMLPIVSSEAGSRCRSGHNGAQGEAYFLVRISCLIHWLWPFHKRGMDETVTSVYRKGKGQETCT